MDNLTSILLGVLLIALVLIVAVLGWVLRRRTRALDEVRADQRATLQRLAAAELRATELEDTAVPAAIDQLRGLHEDRAAELQNLNAILTVGVATEKRKSAEYFKKIDDACSERDHWRRWYYRQSAEHANAQAYLLRIVEGVARAYKQETGKMPPLDPMARSLVAEFSDTHPRLADAGQDATAPQPIEGAQAPVLTGA